MSHAPFWAILFSLGLAITCAVYFNLVVTDSASDLLSDLRTKTINAQADLNALASRIPFLQQCEIDLLNTTTQATNCLNNATEMLSTNTALIVNKTTVLSMNTVSILNSTVNTIITQSCDQIASLQSQILQATLNQTSTVPQTIQTGSVNVSLIGGDSFIIAYKLKQIILGDLRMIYLNLPKWVSSLTTSIGQVNPMLKFSQFDPEISRSVSGSDVFKPLLKTQSDRFVWSITSPKIVADTYKWDGLLQELYVHSVGTSAPLHLVALLTDLNVMMQFL